MMLPSVTQSRLYPMPPRLTLGGWSPSRATANTVILATECSKPQAMKANRHHQIRMHLAASEVARELVQMARQTSQLHSAARATRASVGALILAADAL